MKYDTQYFLNDDFHHQLVNKGYVITDLPNPEMVDELFSQFKEKIRPMLGENLRDGLINVGTERVEGLRQVQQNVIRTMVVPELRRFFNNDNCEVESGVFLVKPSSPNSELKLHQDASIIDEEKYYGLYAWIPLVDTEIENGTMHIVPGSHLLNNNFRSLNVPWVFEEKAIYFNPVLMPVKLKKGQVLFYDNGLVHYSPENVSGETRVAVSSVILPKNYKLIHHYVDETTEKGKLEAYEVNEEFWIHGDIFSRPSSEYPFLGLRDAYKLPFFDFMLKRKINEFCGSFPSDPSA